MGWRAGGMNNSVNPAVAIGQNAGFNAQLAGAIAIGNTSGNWDQQEQSVAIGTYAGRMTLGKYSVAIGYRAGESSIPEKTICINASGVVMSPMTPGFFVKPMTSAPSLPAGFLSVCYNPTTGEFRYISPPA